MSNDVTAVVGDVRMEFDDPPGTWNVIFQGSHQAKSVVRRRELPVLPRPFRDAIRTAVNDPKGRGSAVEPEASMSAATGADAADTPSGFVGWVILELMGHRRLAGWLTEATVGGGSFLRIDVPGADGGPGATQFYAPGAVYAITPTDEATAKLVARAGMPAPVQRWQLPAEPIAAVRDVDVDDGDDAPDEDGGPW